ncbi:hypothetical protein WDU94_008836 [Cyamophila willieti]|uniref:SPRY domain-containing SOCS box protein 3 n=1 Tax=Cacopsylla melanoneura TaxID=428564 RepID=A0A8D9A506_9HEMI
MTETSTSKTSPSPAAAMFKYGCEDSWTWDRNDKSPDTKLFGKNNRTVNFHPTWSKGAAGIRGTRVLNNGRYYWELGTSQRLFGTSMMFGIGTRKARIHQNAFINLIGKDEHSWGLSHKGLIFHNGKFYNYTKPFPENEATRIGVLFDGIAGTLSFYKDGEYLGIAFQGLQHVQEPLYPMICSTAVKTQISLELARRDFINLQDRCRSIIIKTMTQADLELVKLPTSIRNYIEEAMVKVSDPPYQPAKYYILNY